MIMRVRVPATYRLDDNSYEGKTTHAVADFTLGIGPCGKTVEVLEIDFTIYGCAITQVCSCTERKVFVYPWTTVTGRVEVTYG